MPPPDPPAGLELARAYHRELVAPLLSRHLPGLRYAAARVGYGSEVLGLDDAMSRDHDWGPRLELFVAEGDRAAVTAALERHLPGEFQGLPLRFGFSADPARRLRTDVTTVARFADDILGFDPRGGATLTDWLSLTGQAALSVTAGAVFEDRTGELTALRSALAGYPQDVRRHLVACDWQRLDQELPLMSRAGDRGDDLGSRVIAARLIDAGTHLAFLLTGRWAPYPKWRGAALGGLPGCGPFAAAAARALAAPDWRTRQSALGDALDALGRLQRAAGLPAPDDAVEPFWKRPYLQVHRDLVPGLRATITDPRVAALPLIGNAEQVCGTVDVLTKPARRRALCAALLAAPAGGGDAATPGP